MTPQHFILKWSRTSLTERSAAQQHFLDLCEVFEHPKPAEADPTGGWFTFERGAAKHGGGGGWADVWKRGFFGWEYKGKHKDLDAAYDQLLQYREALENPPLLVVCDMDRFLIHTNFTATAAKIHEIALAELGTARNLEILRCVFHEPDKLKPGVTSAAITAEAAGHLADIAERMRNRHLDPATVAHFLDRVVFCLFAEDVGLLPENLFSRIVEKSNLDPKRFTKLLGQLFEAMAHGGDFGMDTIHYFNGNFFAGSTVLELEAEEIGRILAATKLHWSAVDPSIFGTLFVRGMDPAQRSQLGAEYTSRQDIETLVEPVVLEPLRREWADVRQQVENLLATGKKTPSAKAKPPNPVVAWSPDHATASDRRSPVAEKTGDLRSGPVARSGDRATTGKTPSAKAKPPTGPALTRARREAETLLKDFCARLQLVRVLDPACGSGNFLYVTLQKLKDLEKEVCVYADSVGMGGFLPAVGPWQLYGIEISPYAFDLAQMTIWIGWLQWIRTNGYGSPSEPILRPLDTFQCKDAILDLSDPDNPKEPEWPEVDFIVGNPPFLGSKKHREKLGEEYTTKLLGLYKDRVQGTADLCAYWLEKARQLIADGHCKRAGLLSTQTIRGTASRKTLARIKETGDIFFAISDRDWVLDGAAVHVSMVGFDCGTEQAKTLDGLPVQDVHINLKSGVNLTSARKLRATEGKAFMGDTKGGSFNLEDTETLRLLTLPNPHGKPNSDVLVPWANAADIAGESRNIWIIDFGLEATQEQAALYEAPFEFVREHVYPERMKNRRESYRERWWLHVEPRPGMRAALAPLSRFFITTITSKHRLFSWMQSPTLPDHKLIAFAFEDDYWFGVLQSKAHRVWTHGDGSQVREKESGFTYIPTTNFMTFPFPKSISNQQAAVAAAAKELDTLRSNWLNPPEWTKTELLEFPGSVAGPWRRYVHDADERGVGVVRYPRLTAKDEASAAKLKKRTLTNLYNESPAWLKNAHRKLDEAVFTAYGWQPDLSDDELLARLLELNLARSKEQDSGQFRCS